MKANKLKPISLLLLFFFLTTSSFAQIPQQIVSGFQTGNDGLLARYFNENVELFVGPHDDVYSKSQAQQIVAAFFKANKPKQFSIVRQGGNEGARYAFGSLTTSTGTFQVYFLLKNKNKSSYIHRLRIEKQD